MNKATEFLTSNLKSEMERLGWDYQTLADRSGLTRSGVYKIVEGITWPYADNLDRLANALGVSVSHLLKDPGEAEPVAKIAPEVKEEIKDVIVDQLREYFKRVSPPVGPRPVLPIEEKINRMLDEMKKTLERPTWKQRALQDDEPTQNEPKQKRPKKA